MKIRYYKNEPNMKIPRLRNLIINLVTLVILIYQYPVIFLHSLFARKKNYQYEVGLCLIFKNEGRFLREWIEYYKMIGVDHFWLYNNNSDDNFLEIIAPYIEDGTVTLVEWTKKYAQVEAYNDCYQHTHKSVHWLGFIDADEFVNLRKDDDLKVFLHRYRRYPSVNLHWRIFGTSGHLNGKGLITERYVAAWPTLCHIGKAFINNDYKFRSVWMHEPRANIGPLKLYPVSDNKLPVPYAPTLWRNCGIGNRAYLNHYFTKSREWYIYKDILRGSANDPSDEPIKKMAGRFELHELKCSVHDYSIQRWLTLLKERIAITDKGE